MATQQTILGELEIKTSEYQQQLQLLEQEYQQKKQQLEQQRDQELAAAYQAVRQSARQLRGELLAAGKQGGLAEGEMLRLWIEYQQARQQLGSDYGRQLAEREQSMLSSREEYRIKLQKLKDEAELELATLKAKEAETAAKKSSSGSSRGGGSSSKSSSDRLFPGKGEHGEPKETVYSSGWLNLN